MEGILKSGGMPLSVVARVTTWPLIGLLALPVLAARPCAAGSAE